MPPYMLRISTVQFGVSDESIIEEASASFRIVNGTRYISYVLPSVDDTPAVSTIIKIQEKSIEIRRSGGIRGSLKYSLGEAASTQLDLGFSVLGITNETDYLAITELDGNIAVTVRYRLYINDSFVSDCETEIMLTK